MFEVPAQDRWVCRIASNRHQRSRCTRSTKCGGLPIAGTVEVNMSAANLSTGDLFCITTPRRSRCFAYAARSMVVGLFMMLANRALTVFQAHSTLPMWDLTIISTSILFGRIVSLFLPSSGLSKASIDERLKCFRSAQKVSRKVQ